MAPDSLKITLTTVSSLDEAKSLSSALVEAKIAACVNTVKIENSCYEWQGKLESQTEYLLLIKTKSSLTEKVHEFLSSNHPYDTPLITSLTTESTNQAYLDWITASTNG